MRSCSYLAEIFAETLVHSSTEPCDDVDFTFQVFFNMKEHTVYVRQRPFLRTFLERVAEIFEIIVFTASESVYAEKLLDILDPDRTLIARRAYRESCIFSDGSYAKDLTILGVDLARIAIIDNSPQVSVYFFFGFSMFYFKVLHFVVYFQERPRIDICRLSVKNQIERIFIWNDCIVSHCCHFRSLPNCNFSWMF